MATKNEYEEALKLEKKLLKARNRALAVIDDGKARYVKEKTRAKSKKAAMERDALLSSPKFQCLNEFDRKSDINEAYGYDCISEAERDRLEELWDERESIQQNVDDNGMYQDEVTNALREAYVHIADIWEEEIQQARTTIKDYEDALDRLHKLDEKYDSTLQRQYMEYVG